MNTFKFTPGPWAFCNDTLCQATGSFLHLGTFIESPGLGYTAEANKNLIAAAPEMAAALKRAAPWLARLITDGGHLECAAPGDAERTLQQIEDILKKLDQ